MKVTIWNENLHEKSNSRVTKLYPGGIHGYLKNVLECDDIEVRTATLDMPEHGLTEEVLADTDVLLWWGHMGHARVSDEIVDRVQKAVLGGMGLIILHSGHHSKIFKRLMGTTCNLKWRDNARERIWTVKPNHPIAQGVEDGFLLENEEMYGEAFDIPNPDDVIFIGWFNGGEVFRSGCTFTRGNGKIFYFQPGHETNPSYQNENVQKVIRNAVYWACPVKKPGNIPCVHFTPPLENID
ncbi:MAG: trehalose utilization protein ThuA [Ruminococcaceae bacterium]|nr:trehalose utilization protein ThuA [Oscillospiraceae bacterium]